MIYQNRILRFQQGDKLDDQNQEIEINFFAQGLIDIKELRGTFNEFNMEIKKNIFGKVDFVDYSIKSIGYRLRFINCSK